jgi:two-component system response regulator RegA
MGAYAVDFSPLPTNSRGTRIALSWPVHPDRPTGPRTLLIVDDDPCAADAIVRWFRDARWTVRVAHNRTQAVDFAVAQLPDFLVVEQRLVDGPGFDLLPRLKALNPAVVGVVLTRLPSIAAAVHAIRMGFRDYLAKPIAPRRLGCLFGLGTSADAEADAANGLAAANDIGVDGEEPPSLARVEWEHIHSVLLDCRGNISEAARVLGLHRRSLQRKLRRNGPPATQARR